MAKTFFFYDLETSGLSAAEDRIMQFAGQRTNMDLNPIGEPINWLVKMNNDTLPSPEAIMVTGITPQKTLAEGYSEAEFCKKVTAEIFVPDTIAVGFNSVRFDDEFMRHIFWRNFYDPYEFEWRDGRERWDLLDVVRMTRALRPEGINWPVTEEGKATNRLELMTKMNGISHEAAHDALSDVNALIDVTRLIRDKQPQLYKYLFDMRNKRKVQQLVNVQDPHEIVYTSGRYSGKNGNTTVVYPIAPTKNNNVLVFDLRYNLEELLEKAKENDTNPSFYPYVKELKYNHCPAVAPLGVLNNLDGWKKINLDPETVAKNKEILLKHTDFFEQMRTKNEEEPEFPPAIDAESALYDGFLDTNDANICRSLRVAKIDDLTNFHPEFNDPRLGELFLHYKARNFENILSESENAEWEKYRLTRIKRKSNNFIKSLQKFADEGKDQFLLQELYDWYQSLMPY